MTSNIHNAETVTVANWNQAQNNPETNQRDTAKAAQGVLDFQRDHIDGSNGSKAKLTKDASSNASADVIAQDKTQYASDLKSLSALEQTFQEKKVGEDNHALQYYPQNNMGDQAKDEQTLFNGDNDQLNNYRQNPGGYVEGGKVSDLVNQAVSSATASAVSSPTASAVSSPTASTVSSPTASAASSPMLNNPIATPTGTVTFANGQNGLQATFGYPNGRSSATVQATCNANGSISASDGTTTVRVQPETTGVGAAQKSGFDVYESYQGKIGEATVTGLQTGAAASVELAGAAAAQEALTGHTVTLEQIFPVGASSGLTFEEDAAGASANGFSGEALVHVFGDNGAIQSSSSHAQGATADQAGQAAFDGLHF